MSVGPGKVLEVGYERFAAVRPREGGSTTALAAALPPGEVWLGGQQLLLIPERLLEQVARDGELLVRGLCRLSALGPWDNPHFPASATAALAEVEVPFFLVCDPRGWHFFLPEEKKGRALAALRQARLDRFLAPT